jgi:hypothetical protein
MSIILLKLESGNKAEQAEFEFSGSLMLIIYFFVLYLRNKKFDTQGSTTPSLLSKGGGTHLGAKSVFQSSFTIYNGICKTKFPVSRIFS